MSDKLDEVMMEYKKQKALYAVVNQKMRESEGVGERIDDLLGQIYDTLHRCTVKPKA